VIPEGRPPEPAPHPLIYWGDLSVTGNGDLPLRIPPDLSPVSIRLALLFLLLTRGALGRAIFQKVFLDDGEASRLLQKAHAICKAATANFDVAIADVVPLVVGGEDDPSAALAALHRIGQERWPDSSEAIRFTRAFEANPDLARKAHRTPVGGSTHYPMPNFDLLGSRRLRMERVSWALPLALAEMPAPGFSASSSLGRPVKADSPKIAVRRGRYGHDFRSGQRSWLYPVRGACWLRCSLRGGLVMAMTFIERDRARLRWPRSAQAAVFGRRVGESRCAKVVRWMVFFY
jgi:hypothetical protein